MNNKESSFINVPLRVGKIDLKDIVNQLIPQILYEDTSMDGDGLLLKAERTGNLEINFSEDQLNFIVPLDVWAKKDLGVTSPEATGQLNLNITTSYSIKDWNLVTKTRLNDYVWVQKPKVKIGGFDFLVKILADKILNRSKTIIEERLDTQLAERLDLRKIVEETWSFIYKPITLSKELGIFLSILPVDISLAPLQVLDENLLIKLFLVGKGTLHLGKYLESLELQTIKLPDFRYESTENKDFLIRLSTSLSYPSLEKIAQQLLIGKVFTFEIGTVKIENVHINSFNGKLRADVKLTGAFVGNVILEAVPHFNETTNLVSFSNIDLKLKTSSFLYKGIAWMFKKNIEDRITQILQIPLEPHLLKLISLLESKITRMEIKDNFILNGRVDDLEIERLEFTDTIISARMAAKGAIAIEVINSTSQSPSDLA